MAKVWEIEVRNDEELKKYESLDKKVRSIMVSEIYFLLFYDKVILTGQPLK